MGIIFLQKVLVSTFIIFICMIQLFWCLPEGYLMRKIIHKLFYRQVVWLGLDHYWSLFAPDPVSDIFLISFNIELQDGTSIPWELPEITLKNNFQHLEKTRHLKWYYTLVSGEDEASKKAVCEFILNAFLQKNNKEVVPASIHIICHFKPRALAHMSVMPWLTRVVYSLKAGQNNVNNMSS